MGAVMSSRAFARVPRLASTGCTTRCQHRGNLTHVSGDGKPQMVDVSAKEVTRRFAHARTTVTLPPAMLHLLQEGDIQSKKGPVFATAIIAGTMGVKKTSDLIPFCHPLPVEDCKVEITTPTDGSSEIQIDCKVRVTHKTGVEMEALTGSSIAALTVYDMLKAMSHEMVISSTYLVEKTGGKSAY